MIPKSKCKHEPAEGVGMSAKQVRETGKADWQYGDIAVREFSVNFLPLSASNCML